MKRLDEINKKILNILQNNGSITNSELANRIGLAPATTLERVRKLEKSGIIKKYTALVDAEKIDKPITALIEITMSDHSTNAIKSFNNEIVKFPEILECFHVAGEIDYILKVVTSDIKTYQIFATEKIAGIPNIGKVSTMFVLSTIKHDTAIPIE